MVSGQYGQGRTLAIAFDLVASLQSASTTAVPVNSSWSKVLADSIGYATPTPVSRALIPGELYSVRFTVSTSSSANYGATALWYDGMGTAWLAFASPAQVQNGSLPALTATRNLNVQLQTALGANQNLAWAQFTPANDLINGDLLTQLNAQTGSGSGTGTDPQNLTSANPNLLPTAAGLLATDVALGQSQSQNLSLDAPP